MAAQFWEQGAMLGWDPESNHDDSRHAIWLVLGSALAAWNARFRDGETDSGRCTIHSIIQHFVSMLVGVLVTRFYSLMYQNRVK